MKTTVVFDINTDKLGNYSDDHLLSLWHVAQANPAPIEDKAAGELAEHIGREIIRRWIKQTAIPLWNHQGHHHAQLLLAEHGSYNAAGEWTSHAA